jgi:ecdysteroid 25-hydroxylase
MKHDDNEPFDSLPQMQHCLGSLVYSLVFGVKYEQDDPLWKWLQHLQEEGTKLIGVAGPLNFLPWLRSASETSSQNGTPTNK